MGQRAYNLKQTQVWTENVSNIASGNTISVNFEPGGLTRNRVVRRVFLECLIDLQIDSASAPISAYSDAFMRRFAGALLQNLTFSLSPSAVTDQPALFTGPMGLDSLYGIQHTDLGVEWTCPTLLPRYGDVTPVPRAAVTPAVGTNSQFVHLEIPILLGDIPGASQSFAIGTEQLDGATFTAQYGTLTFDDDAGNTLTIPSFPMTAAGASNFRIIVEHSETPDGLQFHGNPLRYRKRTIGNTNTNVVANPEDGLLLSLTMRNPSLTSGDSMAALEPGFHTAAASLTFQDESTSDILIKIDGQPLSDAQIRHMSSWAGLDLLTQNPILGYIPGQLVQQTPGAAAVNFPASRYTQPGLPLCWADPRNIMGTATNGKVILNFLALWTSGAYSDSARYLEYAFVPKAPVQVGPVVVPNVHQSLVQRLKSYLSRVA